ncbi:MAG: VWA domain-containing protein [Cytophagales bacterium]|nr:VWA domain-containing protein [Cytophagales bacterium]
MINREWYDVDWFSPSQLEAFEWAHPEWFWAFLLIPALFLIRWLIQLKFRQKLDIALSRSELKSNPVTLLRIIPHVFLGLSIALLVAALARPQTTSEEVERWTEGIDIVLTVDISESMKIEDFKPNRLEAAKQVASDFIDGRFQDRIGVVIFSGDAYTWVPLTTDYDLLRNSIEDINFELIQNGGTAIGSALGVAINRMRESEAKSKVIILISDGDNTAGNIDPLTAAKLADAHNIKIYSIAIGREGLVPWGKDIFGRPRMYNSTLNEKTLRQVAKIGNGHFYRATDKRTLKKVFAQIDKYEKAEIKENRYTDTYDFYTVYLRWALVCLVIWMLLKSTFITNILQD